MTNESCSKTAPNSEYDEYNRLADKIIEMLVSEKEMSYSKAYQVLQTAQYKLGNRQII